MANNMILNVQLECKNLKGIPTYNKIELWIKKIFSIYKQTLELTIRIVDIPEMIYLNWYYLGKRYPTNILSFPFSSSTKIQSSFLGDIVICKQVIENESKQHNIFSDVHWAHMIIHGSLHLLGYNHILDVEYELMSKIELNIIQKFGYKKCCFL